MAGRIKWRLVNWRLSLLGGPPILSWRFLRTAGGRPRRAACRYGGGVKRREGAVPERLILRATKSTGRSGLAEKLGRGRKRFGARSDQ